MTSGPCCSREPGRAAPRTELCPSPRGAATAAASPRAETCSCGASTARGSAAWPERSVGVQRSRGGHGNGGERGSEGNPRHFQGQSRSHSRRRRCPRCSRCSRACARVHSNGRARGQDRNTVSVPTRVDSLGEVRAAGRPVQLVCGRHHTSALTESGAVFSWGATSFGRLGEPTSEREGPPCFWSHSTEAHAWLSLRWLHLSPHKGGTHAPCRGPAKSSTS